MLIRANIVNIKERSIRAGILTIEEGKISDISFTSEAPNPDLPFMLPGFVDAHVHIESSMLVPSEFAKAAVVHGTVATVSDPHEIANVNGIEGVEFMIRNGATVPFKFNFGAPSCVPATGFETAGAVLNSDAVIELLKRDDIRYLSEMMNFPGVLFNDEEVMRKITACIAMGKPVDGHAPGLMGDDVKRYIEAGSEGNITISTDHECFTAEEALSKLELGMKILIREGSAAKNFDALAPLIHDHWQQMMFCSDDKHPDSLLISHIDQLCTRAVALGIDVFKVLQVACINPVEHYSLLVGQLQIGDAADLILVKDLESFKVISTYINGQLVASEGKSLIETTPSREVINNFNCITPGIDDLSYSANALNNGELKVIEALDGQLITNAITITPTILQGNVVSDTDRDILKLVVVNRYHPAPVAIAFIKNFGLKKGAIASSVAHDSHNIVAVGTDDASLQKAIELVVKSKGGISCADDSTELILPLPVAGLMSTNDAVTVAEAYTTIDSKAKALGCTLSAPFMTLSFMALLVIPHLKLSDKGLFDGDRFSFV